MNDDRPKSMDNRSRRKDNELDSNDDLRVPFKRASAAERATRGTGLCIQGNNGPSTHQGTLQYAFDFRLPTGTPILCSRGGIVAACTSHFEKGGLDVNLRPRANFVCVQHSDGTYARYFHLAFNGVHVKKGDRVEGGDILGLSGNTGFSSAPHLHFDIVDVLPEDTCSLTTSEGMEIPAVSAAFCVRLPWDKPLRAKLITAEPSDARRQISNADEVKGNAVLIDRGGCSFTTKVKNALSAEASIIVIANSQEGPELFSMGGIDHPISIPAVLISKESGITLRRCLAAEPGLELILRSSDGYEAAQSHNKDLHYVAVTQPARFRQKEKVFVPQEGSMYPLASGEGASVFLTKNCCSIQ